LFELDFINIDDYWLFILQGADLATVSTTFECLQSEILSRGHDVCFAGETDVILEHAQALLGERLVRRVVVKSKDAEAKEVVTTTLVPVTTLPDVLELSYYANVISPLFATESVLVNAIYSIVDYEDWTNLSSKPQVTFFQHKLLEEAAVLCSILKYEFMFCPPCQTVDRMLKVGFDRLRNYSLLITDEAVVKDSNLEVKELFWAKRFARQNYLDEQDSDSEEEWLTSNQMCKVNCEPEMLSKFWFFKRVLSPILETYYVASCHLLQLLKNDIPENDFCKSMHKILKERVATGIAIYAESVALDTLKNAIRGFENAGVIHCYSEASIAMIGLTEEYHSEEMLFTFVRRLELYRE
jgi:glycerol-3-phosphate O-acyltransferase 1/2